MIFSIMQIYEFLFILRWYNGAVSTLRSKNSKKKKYMFLSCSWKIHKKLHVTLEIESEVDAY